MRDSLFVGLFEIHTHIVNETSVADGHEDVVKLLSLRFVDLLDDGDGHFAELLHLAVEGLDGGFEAFS